jgi:hypothetical protein
MPIHLRRIHEEDLPRKTCLTGIGILMMLSDNFIFVFDIIGKHQYYQAPASKIRSESTRAVFSCKLSYTPCRVSFEISRHLLADYLFGNAMHRSS